VPAITLADGTKPYPIQAIPMLMHGVYHGKAPGYLADLCVHCSDTRLRSSSRGDFVVQRTRLRLAEKSFSVAGPRAWNSLPSHSYQEIRLDT